jgi:hypothetical protein
MSVLRDSGTTQFTLPKIGVAARPPDLFLEAVREVAADEYEVFGEIGRGHDESTIYLARDVADRQLVVLRLEPIAGLADEFSLEVVKQLDASVAASEGPCPNCGEPPRRARRFCTMCGADLLGDPWESEEYSRQEVLAAVREAASQEYEILGEMPLAEGGGLVYFGRELTTGMLTALRLRQEESDEHSIECSLGATTVLKRLAFPVTSPSTSEPPPHTPSPLEPIALGPSPVQEAPATAPTRPSFKRYWAILAIGLIAVAVAVATVLWIALAPR